jgi:hypothetical protein
VPLLSVFVRFHCAASIKSSNGKAVVAQDWVDPNLRLKKMKQDANTRHTVAMGIKLY